MSIRPATFAASLLLIISASTNAASKPTEIHRLSLDGRGQPVGVVTFSDTEYGLLITPDLHHLEAGGAHGAHIHTHADCGAASKHGRMTPGAAAGNHYDPGETGRHGGPYGTGHLGDLPNLVVEADGSATIPVLAPRLRVADLAGRSIMIHAAADRYQNHASAGHGHGHGKGGVRMYCGVIE
ncbi:superoxide dismutase family protein [uncultured Salinisphaera sp.]|uniref:superoxide dismutase family protein n=1 Tax=uncultured Salinisphaera sp. TaxID=359372 RepID=UPI0032B308A6